MRFHPRVIVVLGLVLTGGVGTAQVGRTVTADDYARAEKFLAANLNGLVVGGSVAANWLNQGRGPVVDDRFWYRNTLADGTTQIVVVNPVAKTRTVCATGNTMTQAQLECAQATLSSQAGGADQTGGRGGRGGRGGGRGAATPGAPTA